MFLGTKDESRAELAHGLIVDLYSNLLAEIWEVVSALVGETVLALLFTLAIRTMGDKHPFLTSIPVSEEGVSIHKMREACQQIGALEIHRGFQGFINHLFQLFSALAEGVIGRELFPKVLSKIREGERIISLK